MSKRYTRPEKWATTGEVGTWVRARDRESFYRRCEELNMTPYQFGQRAITEALVRLDAAAPPAEGESPPA